MVDDDHAAHLSRVAGYDQKLQDMDLAYLVSSEKALGSLAENYVELWLPFEATGTYESAPDWRGRHSQSSAFMCMRTWTKSPERAVADDALRTKQVPTPTGARAS